MHEGFGQDKDELEWMVERSGRGRREGAGGWHVHMALSVNISVEDGDITLWRH